MNEPDKKLDALEQKHARESVIRQGKIDAAMKDVAAAEQMLRDARVKLGQVVAERTNASFAYDAERAQLEKVKAAA